MSKTILMAIGLVMMAGWAMAADVVLVRDGVAACSIVISKEATGAEKRGATEIRNHLKVMSGAWVPIITDAEAMPKSAILVGRSRHTDLLGIQIDEGKLGPDGFVLRTVGNHVAIVGSPVRGTMYGCTELLERLGVRWYTPKVTVVPKAQTVVVPAMDEQQVPAFEYREAFFSEAFQRDWAARMRFNGNAEDLDESTGGKYKYHPFVHSFDSLIPLTLYKDHPEYFPLINGKRMDGYRQRCLSNPEVLKLAIEKVQQWIKERPDAMIYSVSQNDCYEFCTCEKCKEIEAKFGGVHAGLYLWFVNQVAEAIEKDHPDKLIDTLAYQFTEEPPTGITPRKNVRVRLCPIAVCEAHAYEKCAYKTTAAFVKNLAAWAKITDTMYIWHYNTNFANYLMPFPDFEEFPADLRLYKRSGVKGVFFQGAYAAGGGGSDAELRSYVMSRILWNPARESDPLVTEWMQAVYGPAWKPMRQWFDLLHEKARNPEKHFFIFDSTSVHYMTPDVLAEGDRLFDEAEKLAAGNATAREYVAKARLGVRYVKLMRQPTDGAEFQSFVADVKRFGIREIREGKGVEAWEKEYLAKVKKGK